jgi:uncharacterized protein with PQ loop repeat
LEEENIPIPPFESKTNDSITDIFVTASEIVDFIQILEGISPNVRASAIPLTTANALSILLCMPLSN